MGGAMVQAIENAVYVWPVSGGDRWGLDCLGICEKFGFSAVDDPAWARFAIAPRLTRILKPEDWAAR